MKEELDQTYGTPSPTYDEIIVSCPEPLRVGDIIENFQPLKQPWWAFWRPQYEYRLARVVGVEVRPNRSVVCDALKPFQDRGS